MAIDTARLAVNKRLVRRLHAAVWTEGDLEAVDDLLTEDYVEHDPSAPGEIRGRDGLAAHVSAVRSAFAGYQVVPRDVIAEGDIVVFRHTARGTHDGRLGDISPTGRSFEVSGVAVHRLEDGRVAESWVNRDALGLLAQLGVPTPPWPVTAGPTDPTDPNDSETDHRT